MTVFQPPAGARPRLAKFARPRSDGLVDRERLFDLLDRAADAALVWLAAPPGAGKTSLVSTWLAARGQPLAWVQLDAGDADPATLFHYLTQALQGLTPGAPPMPVFQPTDMADPQAFARRYFREWFQHPPEGAVLVLDNVQDAGDAAPWLALLAVMVEQTPPGLRVLALSRSQLPGALARARLGRRVAVIDWDAMRLRRDEAVALAASLGVADAGSSIDGLLAQSQGWAAGLTLMVEHRRRAGDPFADAAGQDLQAVFDYFAGLVFEATGSREQDALMRLSFLPSMRAADAREMAGDAQAERLLAELARRNHFTDRRAGAEPGYQFHALFRVFLQARARQRLDDADWRACALRAARLLRDAGQTEDALPLFLAAEAWADAVALILAEADALVRAGRHRTLVDWIDLLPRAMRQHDPWLQYWEGVGRVGSDPARSRVLVERALAGFDRAGIGIGAVRAIASLMHGWWAERAGLHWLEAYVQRLHGLLADAGAFDRDTEAIGLISLARARLMIRPDDPALAGYVARLKPLLADPLPPELQVGLGTCLIAYYWGIGDSEAATAAALRARPAAERSDVPTSDRLWFWFWLLTHLVYLADVEAGREVMERARALHDTSGLSPPFEDFIRWDVTFELQRGQVDRARAMIEAELLPMLGRASLSTQACIDLEQARCAIEEGRLTDALAHAQRAVDLCVSGGLGWLRTSLGLTLSCAQALSGRLDEADATLATLRSNVGENLPILAGSIAAYQALVHLEAGALDAARAAVDDMARLRRVTTYPWGPGWNRPGIVRVAAFALREGRHVDAMRRIVEGLRMRPPSPDIPFWPWPVRVRVLDRFTVEVAGGESPTGGRKPPHRLLALLQALAAAGGTEVPADELAAEVWPDADGDLARRSLETGLSRLRRLLRDDEAVRQRLGRVSLDPDRVDLDLRAFHWQRARMAGEPAGSPAWTDAAQRALARYRRPLLDGETLSPVQLARRDRLVHQRQRIADALAAHYRSLGHVEEARRVWADAAASAPGPD